jgi:DNA modification methylase/ParB-like chromosome segregation protein Spo0J
MYIDLNAISIGPRQRKRLEASPLSDLEESIRQRGLIHPPTFRRLLVPITDDNPKGEVWQLIVGERRTTAMKKLHEKGISFFHNGEIVPKGMVPILTLQDNLSRADLKQVEFDENKIREPLPWQDEAEALAEIHRLRLDENPQQSRLATAQQLIDEKVVETNMSAHALAQRIQRATAITENLSNPTIAKARNETEAYNLILKGEEEKINASLARRRLAASASLPPISIRLGDCLQLLPTLQPGLVDLIIADPPFGIGADSGGFRQRTIHHHNYEDTPETARILAQAIILEGFRVTKQMANLWMFCDIDMFQTLKEMCQRAGWTPFRTPVVWMKSHSEGMAPWQSKGPRRTYELLLYATKGQRGLITSPVDIFDCSRVSRAERTHGAEKPTELLEQIIECSTLPGDFVLDPCCGSGSSLVAARDTKRTGLGIEKDETFYNTAMSNLHANDMDAPDVTALA